MHQKEGAPYAGASWNLNNLPRQNGPHGNMLRHAAHEAPGVSRPQLDVGMMYSSSAWRVEDQLLYSVCYHHAGEPKKW